jgi:ATP-dependent exoDNAse (exonuclease V) beta subunit
VSRCHVGDQIARMLYVGVSRARNHVYLTGDIA